MTVFLDTIKRHRLKLLILALSYFALASLTLLLAIEPTKIPPVWPPAGLALAACLIFGPRFWPGVFFGSLALHLTFGAYSTAGSLLIATGDALAALIGAIWVLKLMQPEKIFGQVKLALLFFGLAILAAPIISATLTTLSVWLFDEMSGIALLCSNWWAIWLSNASGTLMLTPWLLSLTSRDRLATIGPECFVHWLLVVTVSGLVFAGWLHPETAHYPSIFLILPFIVWAVLRFGALGVASTVLTIAVFATVSTVAGLGPFFQTAPTASLSLLDSYILIVGGTAYVVHALVTEHKAASEELQESKHRLELAVMGAELGTWDWNVQTGTSVFCDRWANMLGYSLNELEPHYRSWERLLHPEDRERVLEALHAHLQGKTDHYETEFRLLTKDGQWKWIATHGRVFERNKDCKPLRAVGIHQDINRQKELEEHVRQRQEELLWVQRFTTAGELAATMAHELNQPLGAIVGYLTGVRLRFRDLLADQPDLDHVIQETSRLAERATDVVQGIRNFINRHKADSDWQDVVHLIDESLVITRPELLRRHTKITFSVAGKLPPIWGQRVLLQQVLINLIMNAMESMEKTEIGKRVLDLRAEMKQEGRTVEIIISDTGPGIAPELQSKIFEPFFSTKPNGIGLGLPICRTISEAHGGNLSIDATREVGASFVLSLPAGKDNEECHVD